MKTNNEKIKNALQNNLQRIDDDSFTNNIVASHLTNKRIVKSNFFVNFLSMVIGLSIVILSIGLVALVRQNNDWISEIGFTETHGLILLTTSLIFVIYKLMDEITAPTVYKTFGG